MSSIVGRLSVVILVFGCLCQIAAYQNERPAFNYGEDNIRAKRSDENTKGERGERGLPGVQGIAGRTGSAGPSGSKGMPGAPGAKGSHGDSGFTGLGGSVGDIGDVGQKGDAGRIGEIGVTGPKGNQGVRGEQGPIGDNGLPGKSGADGRDGVPGKPGEQGAFGDIGEIGQSVQTSESTVGDVGETGRNGVNGNDGLDGVNGAPGVIIWQKPSRTITAPVARTCHEHKINKGKLPTGTYKIDPNGGDTSDAVDVYCKFRKEVSTCIRTRISGPIGVSENVKETIWVSKASVSLVEPFAIAKDQLQDLQNLSKSASQSIEYSWATEELDDMDDIDATLIGWNDIEIHSNATYFTTEVRDDDVNELTTKTMTFKTDRPTLLPFIDMGIKVRRAFGEEFEFLVKIHEVCFKHV